MKFCSRNTESDKLKDPKIHHDVDDDNYDDDGDSEMAVVNRLNPRYSSGVSSPGRHVRTRYVAA